MNKELKLKLKLELTLKLEFPALKSKYDTKTFLFKGNIFAAALLLPLKESNLVLGRNILVWFCIVELLKCL